MKRFKFPVQMKQLMNLCANSVDEQARARARVRVPSRHGYVIGIYIVLSPFFPSTGVLWVGVCVSVCERQASSGSFLMMFCTGGASQFVF